MKILLSLFAFLLGQLCLSPLDAGAAELPDYMSRAAFRDKPYRYVGRLDFRSGSDRYIGTGTVVSPRAVLTAAHVLYDWRTGFTTGFVFYRGRYGGSYSEKKQPAYAAMLAGFRKISNLVGESDETFARDLGLLRFSSVLAGGDYAKCANRLTDLTDHMRKRAVGYGSDFDFGFDGKYPCIAVTTARSFLEEPGYYLTYAYVALPGMSGGPVFVGGREPQIVAIIVSSSYLVGYSGVRAITDEVLDFMRENL